MNRACRSFILFALLGTAGCVGLSSIRYSKPMTEGTKIATVKERYVGDMFVIDDVAFHIYPGNSKSTDLMIFPVPFPSFEHSRNNPPFVVGLAIKTKKSGYSFSPAAVRFWTDSSNQLQPSRRQGPFRCDSSQIPPPWVSINAATFELEPNSCVFMWVEFETVAPDPSQTFFIEMAGLRLNERNFSLPVIKFEEAKRNTTFAVP